MQLLSYGMKNYPDPRSRHLTGERKRVMKGDNSPDDKRDSATCAHSFSFTFPGGFGQEVRKEKELHSFDTIWSIPLS
jgi:hypothetical protein